MIGQFESRRSEMTPFVGTGLLQRRCACGGTAGITGACGECQGERLRSNSAGRMRTTNHAPTFAADMGARNDFAHDFSRVPIRTAGPVPDAGRNIVINGPDDAPKPAPSKNPPPTKKKSACPTDIRVAGVGPANDIDFGKNGFLTGWGGLAQMEVSDPGGTNWDGTKIHESLKRIKNTCGERGKNACSNVSSDQARNTAGSSFVVGAESNFLGKAKLAAAQNRFYDVHVFASKDPSLLHQLEKDTCEVQCQQSYSCGGKQFGPDFIITYTMTRDVVKSGSKNINVTRVAVSKAPAVKQAP